MSEYAADHNNRMYCIQWITSGQIPATMSEHIADICAWRHVRRCRAHVRIWCENIICQSINRMSENMPVDVRQVVWTSHEMFDISRIECQNNLHRHRTCQNLLQAKRRTVSDVFVLCLSGIVICQNRRSSQAVCELVSVHVKPFLGRRRIEPIFPRHHQSCHALVLRLPGTCTHRGICDDDVDARQRQAAKNVSGFGHAGATGSGQCTCNVPRRKGRGPEMAGQWKTTRKIDKWAIALF